MGILNLIQSIDASILLFIQENIRTPILSAIMIFFTTIGDVGAVWIVLSIVMMFFKKWRKAGFCMLVCIGAAWLVNDGIIKHIVCRPRPFVTVAGLEILVKAPTSYSFPSGHSCSSMCAAFVLTRLGGKKCAWFYLPAVLIVLSRIYVGVHYPSDILFGSISGTICALIFTQIIIKHLDRPVSKLLRVKEGF